MIEEYDIEFFKVGMVFRYLEGAREDVVGTINVIDKENCYPDLITLCISCNVKVNYDRDYWEDFFMKILKYRELLN